MSLPPTEPISDANENLPPARLRRQRRMVALPKAGEQGDFLRELAHRAVPSFDFFLFSLLAGVTLGLALLFDSPALVILGALLSPFMAPMVGLALGTVTGTPRFLFMSLGSLLIGSLIVFLCGLAAGWAVYLMPPGAYTQAAYHGQFQVGFFLVLALGAALTSYLTVKAPHQRPMVTSVAIAYGLYLPAAVAGFGLISGIPDLWLSALVLFLVHLVWAAAVSTLALWVGGVRMPVIAGYLLGGVYVLAGAALLALVFIAGGLNTVLPAAGTPQAGIAGVVTQNTPAVTLSPTVTVTPSITLSPTRPPNTATPTPTRTLIPTNTVTQTITPVPTPIWARINAEVGDGAILRAEPNYDAEVVIAILNGTLVEVFPDQFLADETVIWVKVRMLDGREGWIVQSLLRTATPAPNP